MSFHETDHFFRYNRETSPFTFSFTEKLQKGKEREEIRRERPCMNQMKFSMQELEVLG